MSTALQPGPAWGGPAPAAAVQGGRWALNPATVLRWRELDGQWLVFDGGSGQTHLLDPVTAAVLSVFEAGPHDWAELLAALRDPASAPAADSVTDGVRVAIESLLRIGVLEPAAA